MLYLVSSRQLSFSVFQIKLKLWIKLKVTISIPEHFTDNLSKDELSCTLISCSLNMTKIHPVI